MTVRGDRSAGYRIVLLGLALCAAFMLGGRPVVGLVVLALFGAASLRVGAGVILEVRSHDLRYRRAGLLGVASSTAPRSALAAIRVRESAGHEIPTAAVDMVLLHPSLPAAVRVFESLDRSTASAIGHQVAAHLKVPLFDEVLD